ncbi:MAG TPA: threonylcarbamoyl-AMP synthase [Candidatus Omnitrophica bacterium]|nr:MAG: threonylcarbamoyl-AMP synthase [Omnitrophica WOR_2 bacterium GWF2_63_9]OGX47094.1 MAG: threonylcarbamoyl-AMP synthase [Omnitrophica WOR_2 bacterium RIFCSPLOWO2_12_FULL_63_16]HAM41522.1 threonylcarbamoyl-AMP synthase [Candidatus Omnitrophota bacterium]HBQ38058.1 threonylcarbamoyl-AMP synthase [Candidatus Omnitrophota bacterium]
MTAVPRHPSAPQPELIAEAARRLCAGGLVAFPTETVYGLGADATNPQAIARLNQVKGRPPEKPYSLHLYDAAQVLQFVDDIPPAAERLMKRFWPGPLTIVMPSKGGGTVGFRLPSHPVALAFLRCCARAVVAPSANRSGSPPPTDGKEVAEALQGSYDYLLDAGPTPLGRESTVVSVVGGTLTVLRDGAIPEAVLRATVKDVTSDK